MKITNGITGRLGVAAMLLSLLGGCAIYGTTPAYYVADGAPVYAAPAPVYVDPGPVYVDPWYAGPPVFLNFGFRSWGGRHYHGYRGHHGWGRGGRSHHRR